MMGTIRNLAVIGCTAGMMAATGVAAAEAWAVKEAPIRVIVSLASPPTHASAGYFVTIPDGGVLPGPFPVTQVFDESGNALKSAVLWQNSNTGFGLVFARPAGGNTVTVYVTGGMRSNLWTPETGLTPSALIATLPQRGARADAVKLAALGQVGPTVHYRNQPGSKNASLALPGDRSGRPGACSMYMLAYFNAVDPGNTWFSPVSFSGSMEVVVDGRPLHPSKQSTKQGGFGDFVNLTSGLHRLEIYGYNAAGGATGPLLLTCRTPQTSPRELGGIRPADLRFPGTPMWDARQLRGSEIVRSGHAAVQAVESQSGGPVACFTVGPGHIYAFGGETPLLEYRLEALAGRNPAGTKYTWSFKANPGAASPGPGKTWLFHVGADQWVTLTAEVDGKRSVASVPFYPFTDAGCSMNDQGTRKAFRQACLNMVTSYPPKTDPTEGWDESMWNNFFRALELDPQDKLVETMIKLDWDKIKKKMPPAKADLLEDMYLLTAAYREPEEAVRRIDLWCKTPANRQRWVMLQIKKADIMMVYQNDRKGARNLLKPLLLENPDAGEWARIRLGDLEFLEQNLNEATQLYGDVQNRSKHGQKEDKKPTLHGPVLSGPKATGAGGKMVMGGPLRKVSETEGPVHVAAWKLSAIRDVAASESASNLMDQGYYLEAYQAFKSWEREFPLSKISGDFILEEGKFYMWLGDLTRARATMQAYCDQVDASNFVPAALKLVVRCMILQGVPEAEVQKYEKEIEKRLEFRSEE